MLTKICNIIAISTLLLGSSLVAQAGQPFDAKAFQQAQVTHKTILLDVTASWCSTCRQQGAIIQELEKEKPSLVVSEVDFHTAKDVLKRFRVQYQSTLIVFKGASEVGRSIGETDSRQIRAMVAKGF